MGIRPRITSEQQAAIIPSPCISALEGDWLIRRSISLQCDQMYQPPTLPTSTAFRMPLNSSVQAWAANMREKPGSGLSFVKSILIDLPLMTIPPSSIGAAIATSTSPPINGNSAMTAWPTRLLIWPMISLLSFTMPWSKRSPEATIAASWRAISVPPSQRVRRPASSISTDVSSRERGICPSSRAFSSRWGVGDSVLSSSLSSATTNLSG